MTAERIKSIGHIQLFSRTFGAPVRWRMLSGNNREIGRGVESYPDLESCRIGVKEMQSQLHELEPGIRRMTSNEWAWLLARDSHVIAMSGHGFNRLIRCEQGLAQFLANVREAEIGLTLMVSESRRW